MIAIFVDGTNDHYTRGYNFPIGTTPKKFSVSELGVIFWGSPLFLAVLGHSHFRGIYVKVAKDLKHLCFFLKKLISRQREAPESASFNLIPITHNIKGLDVQICRRGSPGGEI